MGFNTLSSHDSAPIVPAVSQQAEVRQAETIPPSAGVSLQRGPNGEPVAVVSPEAAEEIGRREAVVKFRTLMMGKLPHLAGAIEAQRIDTFPIDEEIGRYIPGKYLFIMRSIDERKSPTWFDETGKVWADVYKWLENPATYRSFSIKNELGYIERRGSAYVYWMQENGEWRDYSEDSPQFRRKVAFNPVLDEIDRVEKRSTEK